MACLWSVYCWPLETHLLSFSPSLTLLLFHCPFSYLSSKLKLIPTWGHLHLMATLWKALLPELHVTGSLLFRSSSNVTSSKITSTTRNKIAVRLQYHLPVLLSGINYFVTFIGLYVGLFHLECKLCEIKDFTGPIYHCILRAQKSTWQA